MGILRFFFGFGFWILLYLGLYLWWLFSVVLWMAMFASEVKADGTPPNLASPGSILVLMIACGLGLSTAVTLAIALSLRWSVPWGLLVAVVIGIGVTIVAGMINLWLAQEQSRTSLHANLALCAVVMLGNLLTLSLGIPRPASPPPLPNDVGNATAPAA